jgi:LuxR family maltose regulon positive regulatory protein
MSSLSRFGAAPSDLPSFGGLLRQHRAALHVTQAALAERAGCSPEVVRKFEADAKRPSRQLAERLADALLLAHAERERFLLAARREADATRGAKAPRPAAEPPPARPSALSWLARTKLLPPRVRRDSLDRERLSQAVRRAVGEVRLVLLSAPAGSGKTVLLATALAQPGPHDVVWLTLDDEDNDLVRFLHALVAAIALRHPQAADDAALLLQQAGPGQNDAETFGRAVARALVNGLVELARPLALVLDDLHAVSEPAVYTALDYLLERLPPHTTLAVGTRHDPPLALTRLRARGELAELRLPELRFTAEEVGALLNQRHSLQLSPAELARLHRRTEGWAAGLTLLASSLERLATEPERQQFLERLAHTDRHLFDYLAEEVLNRQDPFVRMFLLETAILPELTPEACQAVTGRSDAGEILDDLYRRNLFLIALEHVGSTAAYRYHDLFREFLQVRLRRDIPEWSRGLHRRAAEAARHPAHRIFHYLQAELWDEAAAAVADAAPDYLAQGAFDTVLQWTARLPEQTRQQRPRLDLWMGMCLWQRFRFDAAQSCFARALVGFDAAGDQAGQGEALAWIALGANLWQDAQTAQTQIDRALAAPLQPHQQVRVLLAFALGATLHERWQEANQALDEAIDLAAACDDQAVIAALAADLQAPFAFLPGGVARYERTLRLLWRFDLAANPTVLISQYVLSASVQSWRGRWEAAEADMQALYAFLATTNTRSWQIVNLGGLLLFNHIVRHGAPTADPALELLLNIDEAQGSAFTRSVALSFQYHYARGQWLLGQLDEARRVYHLIAAKSEGTPFRYVEAIKHLLAGLIAFAERRLDDAAREWQAAAQIQEQSRFTILFSDAHLLLAALEHRRERPDAALQHLAPRLAVYAAEDTPGVLLWHGHVLVPVLQLAVARQVHAGFAARVLAGLGAAAPAPESGATTAAGEALTPREVEVLRLLASGASNPEIAQRLVISLHTVKTHVASILAKLGAPSRAGAAMRARDLGLI